MAFASIRNAVNFYFHFVDESIDAMEVEFMRWRSYWLRHAGDSLPYNTLGVLLSAKYIRIMFGSSSSNIATGPATRTTNERSFSALRYLKTYLQFTTKEHRLNGLALLCAHGDLIINFEHVIDEFSRKNCRLNFNRVKF